MDLLRGALAAGDDPALDVAVSNALVRRISRGEAGAALRVYRPRSPVAAFGRRDARLPGFATAVTAVRDAGFTPVVRPQGGRAVAYTEESVVIDHVSPHPEQISGLDERFTTYGRLWADVLRERGVDARVGAVPGEYCPGAYSVNARGTVKLVGTAQRVVRRAWLFSAVAIVGGTERLRPLLTEVYHLLELPFDAASVGSVSDEAPALTHTGLEEAVVAAYHERFGLTAADLGADLLDEARALLPDHRV